MGKPEKDPEYGGDQVKDFSSTATITSMSITEKDELYDPFEHRDKTNANSDLGAMAHLLKSSLGSGILAMPSAVKNGGLLIGGIGTLFIGIICAHCIHILVRSSHALCRRTKTPQMSYAETAYAAFICGPKPLRPLASASRILVNTALCATYIGGVCVYVVFIAASLKQVVDYHAHTDIPIRWYMVGIAPIIILLGQVRSLKCLVPFSVIANISMMIGFAITLYYLFSDIKPASSVILVADPIQWPMFFSTVLFAIEGIGVVMPVENSMQTPQHFIGCPSVLNVTMAIVVTLYSALGIFGYLKYGDKVQGSITLNIPIQDVLGQAVKTLIAFSVLFTYGLQFFIPLNIVWDGMKDWFGHKQSFYGEIALRFFMAILTILIAALVPDLEPFIGFVGAIFLSILGISIPAIVETISCWDGHLGTFKWRLWKNGILVLFSMLSLIFGSYTSVKGIIQLYA